MHPSQQQPILCSSFYASYTAVSYSSYHALPKTGHSFVPLSSGFVLEMAPTKRGRGSASSIGPTAKNQRTIASFFGTKSHAPEHCEAESSTSVHRRPGEMPGLTAQAGEGAQAPTVKPASLSDLRRTIIVSDDEYNEGLANADLLEPEYVEKDKGRTPSFLAAAPLSPFVTAVTTAHGPAPVSAAGFSSAF
ncbi:hypothetical protein LTR12_008940 [Friedmanniomyces endolithicus]|nr:hypothetical protein LTR12_008940 [Friedmanniomyces endolithicus]